MTTPTEDFTEEFIKVSDLEVDPRVQRHQLNRVKVTEMVAKYNPLALGLIHVSRRIDRANILLDGMHRWEATRIVTDNQGELWCRIFRGLTLAQEAQTFLDLNRTTPPSLIDKFNVHQSGDSADSVAAQEIARIVGQYGWAVRRTAGPGHINAVKALMDIYTASQEREREPNILDLTILTLTSAWGTTDRTAVDGSILNGVAAIYEEYGSNLDTARFIEVLQNMEGGPTGLLSRATQLAKLKGGRRSMAVAETIMERYNKGLTKRSLGAWRKR